MARKSWLTRCINSALGSGAYTRKQARKACRRDAKILRKRFAKSSRRKRK